MKKPKKMTETVEMKTIETINAEGETTTEVVAETTVTEEVTTEMTELERTQNELSEIKTELHDKLYHLENEDSNIFQVFIDFLKNEATWKGQEAMGIVRAMEDIKEARQNYNKTKEIAFRNLTIEAMYYYLSQYQGVGFEKARRVHRALMAISKLIVAVRTDNKRVIDLEQQLVELEYASKTDGLETDATTGLEVPADAIA